MKKEEVKQGDTYQIPVKGSLGLLALGAKGLLAWREVRDGKNEKKQNNENPKT